VTLALPLILLLSVSLNLKLTLNPRLDAAAARTMRSAPRVPSLQRTSVANMARTSSSRESNTVSISPT
jgi:hypothetical protein